MMALKKKIGTYQKRMMIKSKRIFSKFKVNICSVHKKVKNILKLI